MQEKPRILIVDDDEDILDLLKYNFVKENFAVKTLNESSQVLKVTSRFNPSLIILDLIMAPHNGIEVCKMIRSNDSDFNPYIFFLTANANVFVQDAIFNVGGDEYLEKVIVIKTLISKVRCVLKQNFVIKKRVTTLKLGSLELYRGVEEVYKNGEKVKVMRPEFEILFFMLQNPGRCISLTQLTNILWGSNTFMDENTVKSLVNNLRIKIGAEVISERASGFVQLNHKALLRP